MSEVVYRAGSETADCMLRDLRASPEACQTGGLTGAALEPWCLVMLGTILTVSCSSFHE